MTDTFDILYLHPYCLPDPGMLPVGVIGAINALGRPVLGRYAEEVSDAEIRAAKVVLVDIHWFPTLACIDAILAGVRALNPNAAIVAGGHAVSFFAEQCIEDLDLDYIVTGDSERALKHLVEARLSDRDPGRLANVLSRTHGMGSAERLSKADFDKLDRMSVGWFPSFAREVKKRQQALGEGPDSADIPFPFLIPERGCAHACEGCLHPAHRAIFGEAILRQSQKAFLGDLKRAEDDPDIRCVSLVFSRGGLSRYARALKGQRVNLDLVIMSCELPDEQSLDILEAAVSGRIVYHLTFPKEAALRGSEGFASEAEGLRLRKRRLAERLRNRRERRATLFYLETPTEEIGPSALDTIRFGCGLDWDVIRPGIGATGERSADRAHFEEVRAAARYAAEAHLLASLMTGLDSDLFKYEDPSEGEGPSATATSEAALKALLREGFVARKRYGFSKLALHAAIAAPDSRTEAGWHAPGQRLGARFHFAPALRGYQWRATFPLENPETYLIGPSAVVEEGEQRIDFKDYPHLRIPCMPIPPGAERLVTVGGMRAPVAGRTRMWLIEGNTRTDVSFEDPAPQAKAQINPQIETRFGALIGRDWSDRAHAAHLHAFITRAAKANHFGEWRLTHIEANPRYLCARFSDSNGCEAWAIAAPKCSDTRFAATAHVFSYAFDFDGETDASDALVRAFVRLLERLDKRLA